MDKNIISDFYYLALQDLADGADIKELEKAIAYYESLEDYEACAGILKAIEEVRKSTIVSIKTKINEIRKNSGDSGKGN